MVDTAPALTGQDIGEADGALTAVLEMALAPTGRSRTEYLTLRVVDVRGPYPLDTELIDYLQGQRQLGQPRQVITETVDRLRAEGLLTASPVELTGSGREVLRHLASAVIPRTRELFSGLDPADLAAAHRVLIELTDRARTMI